MIHYIDEENLMPPRSMHGLGMMLQSNLGDLQQHPMEDMEHMEHMSLAMAYVPWQHWKNVYDFDKALEVGTIFPELDLPFEGSRGGRV